MIDAPAPMLVIDPLNIKVEIVLYEYQDERSVFPPKEYPNRQLEEVYFNKALLQQLLRRNLGEVTGSVSDLTNITSVSVR